MKSPLDVQIALIEYLKADTNLVTMLGTPDQIKEVEWQGADFIYPAVRVENTVHPNMVDCSPDDVDVTIWVMSEKKSSLQTNQIVDYIAKMFYAKRNLFTASNGLVLVYSRTTEAPYPSQQEGQSVWQSAIQISAQVK